MCDLRYESWRERLGNEVFDLKVNKLTGGLQHDLQLMAQSDIVISTPEKYEVLSRKWKLRKAVQKVTLYILDEVQMVPDQGSTYEVLASRIRYIQNQLEGSSIRVVALGCPIANYKDVASWLGI